MVKKIILGAGILVFVLTLFMKYGQENVQTLDIKKETIISSPKVKFQKYEELNLNYSDPFLNGPAEKKEPLVTKGKLFYSKNSMPLINKEQLHWPDIKIIGEIHGKTMNTTIYIVRIDKSEFSLFEGGCIDSLCLKEVKSNEFTVQTSSGFQKTFQRTTLN